MPRDFTELLMDGRTMEGGACEGFMGARIKGACERMSTLSQFEVKETCGTFR